MVDINLLPEELRKKEEQKKKEAVNRPPVFEVKLSVPDEVKKEDLEGKTNIFSNMFQKKEKPLPRPKSSPLEKTISDKESKAPPKEHVSFIQPKPIKEMIEPVRQEGIHVAGDFGKAKPEKPLAPPPPPPKTEKKIEPLPMKQPPKLSVEKITLPSTEKKKMGFWAWLKSLFRRKKKIPKTAVLPAIQPVVKPKVVEIKMPTLIVADAKKITAPFPPGIPLKPAVTPKKDEFIFSPIVQKIPVPPKPQGMGKSAIPEATPVMAGGKKQKIGKSPAKKPAPYDDLHEPVETLEINLIPEDLVQHPELDIASRLTVLIVSALGSCAVIFGWFLYVQWEGWDIS